MKTNAGSQVHEGWHPNRRRPCGQRNSHVYRRLATTHSTQIISQSTGKQSWHVLTLDKAKFSNKFCKYCTNFNFRIVLKVSLKPLWNTYDTPINGKSTDRQADESLHWSRTFFNQILQILHKLQNRLKKCPRNPRPQRMTFESMANQQFTQAGVSSHWTEISSKFCKYCTNFNTKGVLKTYSIRLDPPTSTAATWRPL